MEQNYFDESQKTKTLVICADDISHTEYNSHHKPAFFNIKEKRA